METRTTIRFCDIVIGIVNFLEFLAFTLPIVGPLACGLILTSRNVNWQGTPERPGPRQHRRIP